MCETIIIAHPRFDQVQSLEARVTAAAEGLTILHADSCKRVSTLSEKHNCSMVLIDSDLFLKNLPDLLLPEETLLLLIAESEQREEDFEQITKHPWTCDVISSTISSRQLRQKLQLVRRLHQVKCELEKCQQQVKGLTKQIHEAEQTLLSQQHYLDILAERDGLTGLYNRKHLAVVLQQEFEQAKRHKTDLSLLLLDIDCFNEINKTSSQLYGDFVLNEMAARLTSSTRDNDICFRFGGGNFIILLPKSDINYSRLVADKLRTSCETKKFDNGQISRHVTISIGIASLHASYPETPDQLIHMADQAMYQAKAEGRNRCKVFLQKDPPDPVDSLTVLQETLSRMMEKTRNSSLASIELLASNVGGESDKEHLHRAKCLIDLFCQRLNFSQSIQQTLKNSLTLSVCFRYLLHKDLVSKAAKLTADELKTIKDLPYKFVELTQLFDYFSQERRILLCHREWHNGHGYPEGLSGDEIPVGAKIFSLADALAAMITDKPYRKRLAAEEILQELERGAGKQWDPQLVLLLLDILDQEDFLALDHHVLTETRDRIHKTLG